MQPKPPTAFISYSWDDDAHKVWVRDLAARLRSDGIETILDQWHAAPGDQLPEFMERAVADNEFVLVICTPRYKTKSDRRQGGVGYEGDVMTGEVLLKSNQRKFIPVLRRGVWGEAAPSWMVGKYSIDLSGDPYSETGYVQLLQTLRGETPVAPPVGGGARSRYRRIYLETFDVDHLDPQAVAERLSRLWLIGSNGPWTGQAHGGAYVLTNKTVPDRPLVGRMRYLEGGAEPDLGNSRVGVRVRVDRPNDSNSGAGLLFRADPASGSYYSFLLRSGNEVSLSLTQEGRLHFLWSEEIDARSGDGFTKLEVQGEPDRIVLSVNDRVLREEKDLVLLTGVPGWTALSIGTFSFKDFAIHQRLD